MLTVTLESHPLLEIAAFAAEYPVSLGRMPEDSHLLGLLRLEAPSPFEIAGEVRAAIRDLLRSGGFKPTGRSKPASEYLSKAAGDGRLSGINPAVDVCNVVSLHSGLPISVIDTDRCRPPLRVGIAAAGSTYVFNPSGQEMDLGGLLCLFDAEGPCANGVKDSQRTKTSAETRRTLTVIWGTHALPGRTERAASWYRELVLVRNSGAEISACAFD